MTKPEEKTKEPRPLEKYIMTVLMTVMTAALISGGSSLIKLSVAMEGVKVTLMQLTDSSKQYVTYQYVTEQRKAVEQQFTSHEKRLTRLENKVSR